MKHIFLFLSLFIASQIYGQETWNACNSTVTVIPAPSYDSTFVLSAPSRAALAKGMANWTPSTSGGASYLVYTALLTQSGTDSPVATVLENTLGGTVVWSRSSAGDYRATLSGAFTENKTVCTPDNLAGYYINALSGSIKGDRVDANSCTIFTPDGSDFSDNGISNFFVEFKVYP